DGGGRRAGLAARSATLAGGRGAGRRRCGGGRWSGGAAARGGGQRQCGQHERQRVQTWHWQGERVWEGRHHRTPGRPDAPTRGEDPPAAVGRRQLADGSPTGGRGGGSSILRPAASERETH